MTANRSPDRHQYDGYMGLTLEEKDRIDRQTVRRKAIAQAILLLSLIGTGAALGLGWLVILWWVLP